jgi:hypothetical protein
MAVHGDTVVVDVLVLVGAKLPNETFEEEKRLFERHKRCC